jgi:hypothetical protein
MPALRGLEPLDAALERPDDVGPFRLGKLIDRDLDRVPIGSLTEDGKAYLGG